MKQRNSAYIGIIFLTILASLKLVKAQDRVTEIRFEGLTSTKISFLQQYVTSKIGESFDSVRLKQDQQRLLNLGILSEVKTVVTRDGQDVILLFSCVEMVNTIPVFTLGQTAGTFWGRVGFQSLNFTGRGDKLFAYYQYYDRHSVYLNYSTDRIGNSKWGLTSSLVKWATIEPLNTPEGIVRFNYTNYTGYVSAVRYLSYGETLDGGIGIVNERFESRDIVRDEFPSIVQGDKLLSKLIFRSNHLNYNVFHISGFYNQLNVEFIHSMNGARNFVTVFNDFRYFKNISSRLNWANRFRVGLATNDPNPFAPFVLDSYLNIRGVGNRVDRGTGSLVVNSELRYTLFDGNKFAGQGVGFMDVGSWRKPGGDVSDFQKSENMRVFSGLGVRLIYKKAFDTMLRLDYGYDYDKNAGWIIGIGQYF
ncbi:hypothetical protein BH09BAC3_BH09BAC3_29160 [soil metagenome]